MARTNVIHHESDYTHEGGIASKITPIQELKRSVLSCMLWEKTFYENGESITKRISRNIKKCEPQAVAALAEKARNEFYLRHVPLWMIVSMLDKEIYKETAPYIRNTVYNVINRADEINELVCLYWRDGKKPLTKQLKLGISDSFAKFNEYKFAKYNRKNDEIKIRDVMFLTHPKPENPNREKLYKKIANNTLDKPDTWEVNLSEGKDKKETFERLINEKKLGSLAFLRNLRNMNQAGVEKEIIKKGFETIKFEKIMPYQYLSAARYAPEWADELEKTMFKDLSEYKKLKGKTILLIDKSGSMSIPLSENSKLKRADTAKSLAIMIREICENPVIYGFNDSTQKVPLKRGFELADEIGGSFGGTMLYEAVREMQRFEKDAKRIIVITDEQSADSEEEAYRKRKRFDRQYMINVAPYEYGVGYGEWIHIDGYSDAVIRYIIEYEREF